MQQLVEQAEEWVCKNYPDAMDDNEDFHAQTMEKFAQLIVRECAQICQDQPNHYALKTDRDNCAVAIKEHFGVK
jgi:hypothetical protein